MLCEKDSQKVLEDEDGSTRNDIIHFGYPEKALFLCLKIYSLLKGRFKTISQCQHFTRDMLEITKRAR